MSSGTAFASDSAAKNITFRYEHTIIPPAYEYYGHKTILNAGKQQFLWSIHTLPSSSATSWLPTKWEAKMNLWFCDKEMFNEKEMLDKRFNVPYICYTSIRM